jgi:hypothetical protein
VYDCRAVVRREAAADRRNRPLAVHGLCFTSGGVTEVTISSAIAWSMSDNGDSTPDQFRPGAPRVADAHPESLHAHAELRPAGLWTTTLRGTNGA